MKRSQRVGAICQILTEHPDKVFGLKYFCDKFSAAKSSISEDISDAKEAIRISGCGYIETISGASGGVKYVPDISEEKIKEIQEELCALLQENNRILGGGFLYTSDIMYNPAVVKGMAQIFAKKFRKSGADYVATVETKGIPLAFMTAQLLNIPSIVIRRETKISEGATVSINYFPGSSERLQKMSISKRAAAPGSKVLIIDDFMRGGGSIKGIAEIMSEVDIHVVGIGVAIASIEPKNKKVNEYFPILYLGEVNENTKEINASPNYLIF
ncbi:MAG: pur operon repressor [Clostridiales bacterium]|nr:pur operon repressor [Clostridiales bacterium]